MLLNTLYLGGVWADVLPQIVPCSGLENVVVCVVVVLCLCVCVCMACGKAEYLYFVSYAQLHNGTKII